MAKFTITCHDDGSQEKRLSFMGKEFIHRMTPFDGGASRALDDDIAGQVGNALSCSENLLDFIYEAFDEMCGEDMRDAIVKLSEIEERERDGD